MPDYDNSKDKPVEQDNKFEYSERNSAAEPDGTVPLAEPANVTTPIYAEGHRAEDRRYESPAGDPYFEPGRAEQPPFYAPDNDPYFDPRDVSSTEEITPRRRKSTMWIALGVVALLIFSSLLALQAAFKSRPATDIPILPPSGSARGVSAPSPGELSKSFREISTLVKPAVVFINITEKLSDSQGGSDPFGFGLPNQGQRRSRSAGSGVIVTEDGYIITNNHVVANASKIEVTLSNNRKYKATVIGTDSATDLAVIKIEETGLPMAVLCNSDDVQQGDWVLALGSPFGLQQTLTAGIVSATGREYGTQLGRFIQTDASINPGNSGGPLISMNAEIIGINTFIISRTSGFGPDEGGNVGIGFAVTSNVVRQVFSEIVKKGKVTRGYLGVNPVDLDEAKARAFGVEPNSGVLISNIPDPNAPAGKAGIRSGDIITAFDGKKVASARELTDTVTATPVGKSCRVDFLRDGQPQSVTVELIERPTETAANRAAPDDLQPELPPSNTVASKLGVEGQEITPEMASRLRLDADGGVLVRQVQPNSPAAEGGITHGDILRRIDRHPIRTTADLSEADKSLKAGDEIAVQVVRRGRTLYLNVTIE